MNKTDELNTRMKGYIAKHQRKLDGEKQKKFLESNSQKLNIIKRPVERTRQYQFDYAYAKSLRRPTMAIRNRWVRDVERYANMMCDFDKQIGEQVFCMPNDFRVNVKTQNQFQITVMALSELYNERLKGKVKDMTKSEKDSYFDSIESDRDFIRSYFDYEKYQEREREHDDGDTPTEELVPKKSVQKEKPVEYADTTDKSLKIPRVKDVGKLIENAGEKAKKLKQEHTKSGPDLDIPGKGKDDDWLSK